MGSIGYCKKYKYLKHSPAKKNFNEDTFNEMQ